MRLASFVVRSFAVASLLLTACQPAEDALESSDGGMDGGSIEMRSTVQALETGSLCGNMSGLQTNAPWPMRSGCPGHNARASEAGPTSAVKNWSFDTFGDVRSSAAVTSDGSIIIGGDNGKVYRLNPTTGAIANELLLGGAIKSTPALSQNEAFVTSESGKLNAIALSTFTLKWSFPTGGAITSSPVILADGSIVFGSSEKSVWSVSPSGTKLWSYKTGGAVSSSPAVSPDAASIFVGSEDTHVYSLNSASGLLLWKTKLAAAISTSPALTKFNLVIVPAADKVYALDATTGAIVWQRSLGSSTVYSPAINRDGIVLVGVKNAISGGALVALRPADGTILWQYDTLGGIETTPAIDALGNAYFGGNDGNLYGVTASGRTIFKHTLPNGPLAGIKSSPVLVRGALVFGGDDNWVQSFGSAASPPLLPGGSICNADAECEPRFVCGIGKGAQFGKPAGSSVCWLPSCENKVKDPAETDVDCGGPCGSCTSVCSQGCVMGSQVTPPALETLSFSKGGFLRGSDATYQVGTSRVALARGDQLRYEDRGDGHGRVALFEGPRTNRVVWSEGMGHLPEWWIPPVGSPMMTLTENAITSPDGKVNAERWVAPAGALPSRTQTVINAMPAGVLSTWLRLTNPASYNEANPAQTRAVLTDLTGGWYSEPGEWVLPPTWQRYTMSTKPSIKSTGISLSHKPAWPGSVTEFPALIAADLAVWGWQLEEGKFPSSYIQTQESAVTRKVDQIIFESKDVPAWVRSGLWQFDALPLFGASEIAVGEEYALVSWEGGYLALSRDAAGGLIKIVSGTKVATSALGWSSRSKLVITVNAATSTLSVRSAGKPDVSLAYGVMAIGTGKVGMGALLDGTKPAFARLSELRKVAAPTVLCASDPDCSYCGDGRVSGSEVCDSALDAHCGHGCVPNTITTPGSSADCPPGQVFLENGGGRFGLPSSTNVCWPGGTSGICPSACGTYESPCGLCVSQPSCAGKRCGDDSRDGVGGHCPDLCQPREPGCLLDSDCTLGFSCGIGMGPRMGKPAGTNICWPIQCDDYMPGRLDCGSVTSLCGVCPTMPSECEDRTCGTDQYGRVCGTCAAGLSCNAAGQCIPPVLLQNPTDPGIIAALVPAAVPTSPAGSISGTFAVSNSGTATYSVPLAVPPGRAGLQPGLSLDYDSGRGEGFLTAGWSLNGLSAITRCPSTYAINGDARGVRLDQGDRFCLDGQQLMIRPVPDQPLLGLYGGNGAQYRTELDSFVRVASFIEPRAGKFYQGPSYFKAWTKDGKVLTFGRRKSARVWASISDDARYSPSEPVNAAWMLEEIEDRHGNVMTVSYRQFTRSYGAKKGFFVKIPASFVYSTEIRPFAISYGARGSHRVEIAYSQDRAKSLGWNPRTFASGIGRSFSQPIHEVRTFVNNERVATYKIGTTLVEGQWKLTSLTACASQAGTGTETCHPPTTFEYEPIVPISRVDTADPLGGHIETSWKCKDCGALNRDRRGFSPGNYNAYFAFPANLDGDAYDDMLNLEFTGEGEWRYKSNTLYHSFVDLYQRRALPRNSRAFTEPGPWTLGPEPALSDNLHYTSDPSKIIGREPKTYVLSDDDFDGKEERLTLERVENRPDLNGDGIRDRAQCSPGINGEGGLWFYDLAIGPAVPGGQLRFADRVGALSDPDLDCWSFTSSDYDGDGADELLVTSGEDTDRKLYVISLEGQNLVRKEVGKPDWLGWDSDFRMRSLDANGDGLRDYLMATDGRITLYLGTGRDYIRFGGTSLSTLRLAPKKDSDEDLLFAHAFVWDHNGDGRDELFLPADKPGDANDKWAMIEPFVPGSTSARRTTTDIPYVKVQFTSLSDDAPKDIILGWQKPTVLDWDGNGVADVIFRNGEKNDPTAMIWKGGSKRSGLLKKVKDGFARVTTVQYSDKPEDGIAGRPHSYTRGTGCRYPQKCLPKLPHPIVVAHETTADLGTFANPRSPATTSATARRRFEYSYADARTDVRGRGWLGFRERTVREVAGEFPAPVISETTYHSDLETKFNGRYIGAGRPKYILQNSFSTLSDGTPVRRLTSQTFDWNVEASDAGRPWVALRTHSTKVSENSLILSGVDVSRTYDAYGNTREETSLWEDGRLTTTVTTYAGTAHRHWLAFENKWLVGLPETVTVSGVGDSRGLSDPGDRKSYQIVNDYDAVGDLVLTERRADERIEQRTVLSYDNFGNVLTNQFIGRSATGDTITTGYDGSGMYPISQQTDTHHLKGIAVTQLGFDPRTGQLRWRKNSDGNWQAWHRDAFGRVVSVYNSNGTASPTNTQIRYSAGTLVGARFMVSSFGSSQPNIGTEYNGLGQPIYRRSWDIDNAPATSTVQEWGYDSRGQLIAESSPHFFRDPVAGVHEFAYDEIGRLIREAHPLVAPSGAVTSATTTHAYFSRATNASFPWAQFGDAPFAVSDTPPLAPSTTKLLSMRGELSAAIDPSGNATHFVYGAFGHLRQRRFLGLKTVFVTDNLGRLTQMSDPISGVHDYVLDGLGHTREYRHNGKISSFEYDGLGRPLSSVTPDGTYKWTWDGNRFDPSQAGRLMSHSVTSPTIGNATTSYEYRGGAVTGIERMIEGERFFTKIENTPDGMPKVIHSPGTGDSEVVKYTYNAFGRVTDVTDGADRPYWHLVQSDAYGNDAEVTLMGGLTSRKRVEPATGRLALAETVTAAGTRLQQEEYQYGPRGLLFRKNDKIGKVDRQYFYDGHGRLDYQTVNNVTQQFDYDAYGNLTLKPEVGTLHYDPAKPYQLTATDSGSSFGYDTAGNGRQILRAGSDIPEGIQSIEYTAFDLPTKITNGPTFTPTGAPQLPKAVSSYRYDASNARTLEQVKTLVAGILRDGPRTVYVGDIYRRVTQANNTSDQIFRVPLPGGGGAEVTRTSAGARTVQVLHTDHLGSTVGVTNAQGSGFTGRSYESFGRPSVASAVKAGFTGHEHDSGTGLINMRGRMYDPMVGRFMTPDPLVQSPADSQSWNRYSYVMNSPLSFTDPSGFCGVDSSADCTVDVQFDEGSTVQAGSGWADRTVVTPTHGADALGTPTGALAPAAPAPDMPPILQYNLEGGTYVPQANSRDLSPITSEETFAMIPSMWERGDYLKGLQDDISEMKDFDQWERDTREYLTILLARPDLYVQAQAANGVRNPDNWLAAIFTWTGIAGAPRAYSVAFETTIARTGVGTREAHKAAANRDLAKAMSNDAFNEVLSSVGVKPVGGAGTPAGFRWHHAADRPGVMQLVPENQHTSGSLFQELLHPGGAGGFAQWGRTW